MDMDDIKKGSSMHRSVEWRYVLHTGEKILEITITLQGNFFFLLVEG